MKSERLVIGRIPFLVALGFYHLDLETEQFINRDGTPAELNDALRKGEIDLAPASSFEYLRNANLYALLPDFCTSGVTAIRSALLFSKHPWQQLEGKTISLPSDSASAAALLKILLQRDSLSVYFQSETEAPPCSAQLLIGNRALIVAQRREWPYCYDLCTLWNQWQNLPFAFGAWIVRKKSIHHPELLPWRKHLAHSVECFRANPQAALTRWQKHHQLPEEDLQLDEYWNSLEYRMGKAHHTALERFAELAYKARLIDRIPKIEYLEPLDYSSPHS